MHRRRVLARSPSNRSDHVGSYTSTRITFGGSSRAGLEHRQSWPDHIGISNSLTDHRHDYNHLDAIMWRRIRDSTWSPNQKSRRDPWDIDNQLAADLPTLGPC